ncbi:BRO-N domain-containing protein [Campylobacter gastrosuis]|uniref:BRO family protein n=1 Tax=Campylobacter gastrosuis TaxID=2974576 RepID=A0ABT7HQJ1_9BACT|nr:BRO family protein [Campylobacter gastrosuis]MDL0089186.1 BRO family protein [Campylobacter gastrosuis]
MNLEVFRNDDFEIRVAVDEKGEPLFCLADICKVLELANPTHAVNAIKSEFELPTLNVGSFDTGYGVKEFTMITEPQLYFVLMRSDKPNAKAFRKWVNCEVLPSIRKTGSYHQKPLNQLDFLQMQLNVIRQHDERITAIEQKSQKDERRFRNLENTAKRDEGLKEYTTAVGFGILKGISLDKKQCQRLGTKASKLSKEAGVLIVTIPDQKHGKVGTYRHDILEKAFNELNF